ncbi:hypothetical protein Hanom_Chr07g00623211 [Helianthus anomalus]
MSTGDDVVTVEEASGGLPPLKWVQGLFEQPPGYITLFVDFFSKGNFRLLTTHFIGNILQYYGFHISQRSPMGTARVRHFVFVFRSQGKEPTIEKFRCFYPLQSNM